MKLDKKYVIGLVLGFMVATLFSAEIAEAGVPPTRAIQSLNITLPWFSGGTTLVETDSSSDIFHFVSDGSITFNVTSTAP